MPFVSGAGASRLVTGTSEAHLALESEAIALQGGTAEGQEGIHAFLGKRKPKYV